MSKQDISVTTDCVVICKNERNEKILLVKKKDPFKEFLGHYPEVSWKRMNPWKSVRPGS